MKLSLDILDLPIKKKSVFIGNLESYARYSEERVNIARRQIFTKVQFCIKTIFRDGKFARGDKIVRRQFCTVDKKKSYRPRVKVRGKSDSKNNVNNKIII